MQESMPTIYTSAFQQAVCDVIWELSVFHNLVLKILTELLKLF